MVGNLSTAKNKPCDWLCCPHWTLRLSRWSYANRVAIKRRSQSSTVFFGKCIVIGQASGDPGFNDSSPVCFSLDYKSSSKSNGSQGMALKGCEFESLGYVPHWYSVRSLNPSLSASLKQSLTNGFKPLLISQPLGMPVPSVSAFFRSVP